MARAYTCYAARVEEVQSLGTFSLPLRYLYDKPPVFPAVNLFDRRVLRLEFGDWFEWAHFEWHGHALNTLDPAKTTPETHYVTAEWTFADFGGIPPGPGIPSDEASTEWSTESPFVPIDNMEGAAIYSTTGSQAWHRPRYVDQGVAGLWFSIRSTEDAPDPTSQWGWWLSVSIRYRAPAERSN